MNSRMSSHFMLSSPIMFEQVHGSHLCNSKDWLMVVEHWRLPIHLLCFFFQASGSSAVKWSNWLFNMSSVLSSRTSSTHSSWSTSAAGASWIICCNRSGDAFEAERCVISRSSCEGYSVKSGITFFHTVHPPWRDKRLLGVRNMRQENDLRELIRALCNFKDRTKRVHTTCDHMTHTPQLQHASS